MSFINKQTNKLHNCSSSRISELIQKCAAAGFHCQKDTRSYLNYTNLNTYTNVQIHMFTVHLNSLASRTIEI